MKLLWLKELFDRVVSLLALIILFIPFLIIGIIVKLDSKGPIFFRQERVGKGMKPFRVFKFRTMSLSAPAEGFGYHVSSDNPHLTKSGKVLRNWGVDELPQLMNVFLGHMSLVGPRPVQAWQTENYSEEQMRRLDMKPGITGLAVIRGRNTLSWEDRIKYDIEYVDSWSFWLDIRILFKTFWTVLVTKEGVFVEDTTYKV